MSWLGKVAGGFLGLLAGGPLGAAFGAAIGHQFDQAQDGEGLGLDEREAVVLLSPLSFALFQVMGGVAKSDGRVSEAEIRSAALIMDRLNLPEPLRVQCMRLFYEGKQQSVGQSMAPVRGLFAGRPHLARRFIALQTEAALADGFLQGEKEAVLLELCRIIGFSRYEFSGIRTRLETEIRFAGLGARKTPGAGARRDGFHGTGEQRARVEPPDPSGALKLRDSYALLGLSPWASDLELKQAYRRAISLHHPDKLAASAASPLKLEQATRKAQEVQKAYECILKSRSVP